MDSSYSESDMSLSPSQILERLDMLRQIQSLQRGKLYKYNIDQTTSEFSPSVTEVVSHVGGSSTSYNTFRSLLQSPRGSTQNGLSNRNIRTITLNTQSPNYIMEGVSILNLSQESEYITNSPTSTLGSRSNQNKAKETCEHVNKSITKAHKKNISLDEMPILSPKKNFEELVVEKLKNEKSVPIQRGKNPPFLKKKTFLKRGEGMSRFGINKTDLVIQNTKSLPWRRKSFTKCNDKSESLQNLNTKIIQNLQVQPTLQLVCEEKKSNFSQPIIKEMPSKEILTEDNVNQKLCNKKINVSKDENILNCSRNSLPKEKMHPLRKASGKTWAAVLTKEQDDFLRQLKQSEYYKNWSGNSPSKSVDSDFSAYEQSFKSINEKEIAEQHMFELIENKATHESFNMDNSFICRFLRKNKLECSGESTPMVMQKCLSQNPALMHIFPDLTPQNTSARVDEDACYSDCIDCSEACCATESCCSCSIVSQNNLEENIAKECHKIKQRVSTTRPKNNVNNCKEIDSCHNDTIKPDNVNSSEKDKEIINANMAEMNAKLIATSDLLKERLHELEDEIETFRKENANISKMKEEVDLDRQNFYKEKAMFEQKYNEEKVLSEYYLADEKEKLAKQKQIYERYVRDMRGKLNKKDKEEVTNLKKEITDLKEEIKIKDAKSTSLIARLRNQIKLMEKDKKALDEEVEKLKKEIRRIQHSNDVTRRLTNLNYLEQINKKLSDMASRDTRSNLELDSNMKYKAFEIEKQSQVNRNKTIKPRTRAKSVPNLNVTSKYAKYFSQKDSVSERDKYTPCTSYTNTAGIDPCDDNYTVSENVEVIDENISDEDNYLEKIYNERFKSMSPPSKKSSDPNLSCSFENNKFHNKEDDFFIEKLHSVPVSKERLSNGSDSSYSKSYNTSMEKKITAANNKYEDKLLDHTHTYSQTRNKSPVSILSNRSSGSQKLSTVIHKEDARMLPSPEPTISKTSLNPTECIKPDGTRELRFPNGNVKIISSDGQYSKFIYYNGDIKESFYKDGRVKYFYAHSKIFHTTYRDGLEALEFPDGQIEKRYKDGSSEIRLPNGSIRYFDPKNEHVHEEWRFADGTALTVSANGEQRIIFPNGQIEVHTEDHKRREYPDGTVKLVYNDGTSETRYASGRVRIKDNHGNLIMDSATG